MPWDKPPVNLPVACWCFELTLACKCLSCFEKLKSCRGSKGINGALISCFIVRKQKLTLLALSPHTKLDLILQVFSFSSSKRQCSPQYYNSTFLTRGADQSTVDCLRHNRMQCESLQGRLVVSTGDARGYLQCLGQNVSMWRAGMRTGRKASKKKALRIFIPPSGLKHTCGNILDLRERSKDGTCVIC